MGLAWYISNEHYYPEALKKVVSKLKLRFSIGSTGNDDTGGNRFLYRGTMKQDNSVYNIGFSNSGAVGGVGTVSYTHLDVYKRQPMNSDRTATLYGFIVKEAIVRLASTGGDCVVEGLSLIHI